MVEGPDDTVLWYGDLKRHTPLADGCASFPLQKGELVLVGAGIYVQNRLSNGFLPSNSYALGFYVDRTMLFEYMKSKPVPPWGASATLGRESYLGEREWRESQSWRECHLGAERG